jgi:hypothetical protein
MEPANNDLLWKNVKAKDLRDHALKQMFDMYNKTCKRLETEPIYKSVDDMKKHQCSFMLNVVNKKGPDGKEGPVIAGFISYRLRPRCNKIGLIAFDSAASAQTMANNKLKEILNTKGWVIETYGKFTDTISKLGVHEIKDIKTAEDIFDFAKVNAENKKTSGAVEINKGRLGNDHFLIVFKNKADGSVKNQYGKSLFGKPQLCINWDKPKECDRVCKDT